MEINDYMLPIGAAVLLIMLLFGTVGLYELGKDQILEPVLDASEEVISQGVTVDSTNATIQALKSDYDNIFINFDLYMLMFLIFMFTGSTYTAYKAKKQSIMSFFGLMFMGTLGILFLTFFVSQFTDYLLYEVFFELFPEITTDFPFLSSYLEYLGIINGVWFVWLVVVNQLDIATLLDTEQEKIQE